MACETEPSPRGAPISNGMRGSRLALPSEEREAPESLNSSVPICIGNTRSCGRILGIRDIVVSLWALTSWPEKSGDVSIALGARETKTGQEFEI